jgi:hypothetical protein
MKVTLNPFEQWIAKGLAAKRLEQNQADGARDMNQSGQDPRVIELEGIGGELAYCKLFNIYPDLQYTERAAEDAISALHGRVDVKTAAPGRNLVIKATKQGTTVAGYVLMLGAFPEYEYAGYMPTAEALADENLKTIRDGQDPCYFIPVQKLRKP